MPALLRTCHRADRLEAGVDEVGRGCLAGPVVAAAVVWNPELDDDTDDAEAAAMLPLVRDSKTLSAGQRERVAGFIRDSAVAHAVAFVDNAEIDRSNILRASVRAMHEALDGLGVDVDCILVDGDRFRAYQSCATGDFVPHACIVNGDATYMSIAAASILAKVERDAYVRGVMHPHHPEYGWDRNVGYGTPEHLGALQRLGPTPFHRLSFAPMRPPAAPPDDATAEGDDVVQRWR